MLAASEEPSDLVWPMGQDEGVELWLRRAWDEYSELPYESFPALGHRTRCSEDRCIVLC